MFCEGSAITMTVTGIRFLTPDLAVVHTTSTNEFSAQGTARQINGSFTLLFSRGEAGDWLINALHNGVKEDSFTGHLDGAPAR